MTRVSPCFSASWARTSITKGIAGVDVAFALELRRPGDRPEWMDKLLDRRGTTPIVGVNVSGLLALRGSGFDLQSDYGAAMRDLVVRLAEDAFVVLVPHSGSRDPAAQSDPVCPSTLVRTPAGNGGSGPHRP